MMSVLIFYIHDAVNSFMLVDVWQPVNVLVSILVEKSTLVTVINVRESMYSSVE